jgi:DNA-binding transcriptional regulator/RsmH inhibitor MraZ
MAEPASHPPTFNGELERMLDSGLRVMLPKDWRSHKITEFFVFSDSTSSFVKVLPRFEYDRYIAKIETNEDLTEKERNEFLEEVGSTFTRVLLDSAGRLALPAEICEKIEVGANHPKVILKGAVRTFNIWNPAKLTARQQLRQKMADTGQGPMSAKEFLGV